jgi:hypothetical protein
VYDWLKPTLASRPSPGGGRRSARASPGALTRIVVITHSQKAKALVCGLSTEHGDALSIRRDHVGQRLHGRQSALSKSSG